MFLAIDYLKITYTIIFLVMFFISYYVVLFLRFEELFKKGSIWPIRIGQVLLSLIIAYLATSGIMSLINNTQF